ncbi:MAG: Co2+/Mg2+ efflux protein ApaG [Planctomycetes bacterium]|nr:Co2+/Mg2+ efflux protein ApaG [Planctomycetota bacterium]MCB9868843.1 Co2+/Mg2+ efflux protein ApaG [Planctomycetota bacterium]MCB9889557.1 Co2+/Mg2+ efflux protein ApaG [Planctomycetota bacterium]
MIQTPDSDTVTEQVRVRAAARYLPDESDPDLASFLFMYRITIANEGTREVKLLSRHWVIRDAFNERSDVRGPGVVGEYPVLAPGERYEYKSTCKLRTHWGTMEGSYQFEETETGRLLTVEIGRFFLVPPAKVQLG